MIDNSKPKQINRRRFIKVSTAAIVGGTAVAGAGSVPFLRSDTLLLRPPGALDEDTFLASCIKCGQCLQVCPPQVIELAFITRGFGVGTPYITPRIGGCILCAGLPCVLACPTGALDHGLSEGKDSEMGLAVVSQPETCLSIQGINDLVFNLQQLRSGKQKTNNGEGLAELVAKSIQRLSSKEEEHVKQKLLLDNTEFETVMALIQRLKADDFEWLVEFIETAEFTKIGCRICLDECPIKKERTITFEDKIDPTTGENAIWPIVQKTCVGCGVCEEKCPTQKASITITPRLKWMEEAV